MRESCLELSETMGINKPYLITIIIKWSEKRQMSIQFRELHIGCQKVFILTRMITFYTGNDRSTDCVNAPLPIGFPVQLPVLPVYTRHRWYSRYVLVGNLCLLCCVQIYFLCTFYHA